MISSFRVFAEYIWQDPRKHPDQERRADPEGKKPRDRTECCDEAGLRSQDDVTVAERRIGHRCEVEACRQIGQFGNYQETGCPCPNLKCMGKHQNKDCKRQKNDDAKAWPFLFRQPCCEPTEQGNAEGDSCNMDDRAEREQAGSQEYLL